MQMEVIKAMKVKFICGRVFYRIFLEDRPDIPATVYDGGFAIRQQMPKLRVIAQDLINA
jgi:hypothetical protein